MDRATKAWLVRQRIAHDPSWGFRSVTSTMLLTAPPGVFTYLEEVLDVAPILQTWNGVYHNGAWCEKLVGIEQLGEGLFRCWCEGTEIKVGTLEEVRDTAWDLLQVFENEGTP